MSILRKSIDQRIQEQKLINVLREIQRKKHQEVKEQISLRDKKKLLLFKDIKKRINRRINQNYSKLPNKLKKGIERYIFIELNSHKDLSNLKQEDINKIIDRSLYFVRKSLFYNLFKVDLMSKRKVRQQLYEKIKEVLKVD
jgi:hypothetical protein